MAEGIEDKLKEISRQSDVEDDLGPDNEVFSSFAYTSPTDKKAAAKYFKKAVVTWTGNSEIADEYAEHELGHALADKKSGQFVLHAKVVSEDASSKTIKTKPSYTTLGKRSLEEHLRIAKRGGGILSETDKRQIELLEQEIKSSKKSKKGRETPRGFLPFIGGLLYDVRTRFGLVEDT